MNGRSMYVLIAILAAIGAISVSPVLAAELDEFGKSIPKRELAEKSLAGVIPIVVSTDKEVYDHESIIQVEGKVANFRPGTPVTLTVISPLKNIITIDQLEVDEDRMFRTSLNTAGNLWKYDGDYTIRVQYGGGELRTSTVVELSGGIMTEPSKPVQCGKGELSASGNCIPYDISGGTVTSAVIDKAMKALVMRISPTDEGSISLKIPRSVLDAQNDDGHDQQFFISVDDEEAEFEETGVTSSSRRVTIMFPDTAQEILIVGTYAIPEFGAIATLILAVAIISIIAVTARTRIMTLAQKY